MSYTVKLFSQDEAKPYAEEIGKLRIQIFKEFPYLYEGKLEDELEYGNKFIQTKDSFVCMAFDGDKVIGAFTGLPFSAEDELLQQPWKEKSETAPSDVYYFSEALLLPEYRSKGVGKQMFDLSEAWVTQLGRYKEFAFITVIRPDDHPLKPADYVPLESLWEMRGYRKTNGIVCRIPWLDIGEDEETMKDLLFWSRRA